MSNRSKDRSSLCSFTFADGRQCRTPRAAHPYLCAFHTVSCSGGSSDQPARWPRAPSPAATSPPAISAPPSDASSPLSPVAAVFRPAARWPRASLPVIPTAARDPLFAVLVQTLHLAQHEYINAYGTDSWRETIRISHEQSANHSSPDPESPTAGGEEISP